MKLFRINSVGSALRALIGWPLLAAGIYMLAALVGSLLVGSEGRLASNHVRHVYLHDNGIHTSIILQRKQRLINLDIGWPASDLRDNPPPAEYLMFGWGDRDFYLNTPSWTDLQPHHAINALTGSGQSLLHVYHLQTLPKDVKKITVEIEDFNKILSAISRTMQRDKDTGKPRPIPGYGDSDVFYPAQGYRYSALFTCNNWVSHILAKGNVRTGLWTPLPFGVMWWH